jgi:hypothetical protein
LGEILSIATDMRGIKDGWYATEKDGNLVAGPFSSREDCLKLLNPIISAHIAVSASTTDDAIG